MLHRSVIMLGIESSCDETAAAIVTDDKTILANEIASQIGIHAKHGGVVPEVAARAHLEVIDQVISDALAKAKLKMSDIDGVAATAGPGLIGGVAIGTVIAKAIAAARHIPYYAVNHLEGHALSPRLADDVPFPYLLLLVSGGHTQLLAVVGPRRYHRYGTTMDDAAGEAFDKCAKAMGLGYPGGPAIEATALSGDSKAIALPRPLKGSPGCHFSFSGLKTALANKLHNLGGPNKAPLADLAASLQAAISDCLVDRTKQAMARFLSEFPPTANQRPVLVIAGGVAANKHIFSTFQQVTKDTNFRLSVPPAMLCTDNAAMIAWAALERLQEPDLLDFAPRPRWPLDPNASPPPGRGVRQ
ncbi:tRNA (adenosine(37)-N6)-threonylcarbamoyltransferase complex transferase subunit TsaD [Candidatus Puniceispirillum sp.]|nr:tRNA (adenosine(37)-N6)-threonylcarbamoyltransferase complex transferase subunit TsaD [Candidatus Puniceispirillum sp.]